MTMMTMLSSWAAAPPAPRPPKIWPAPGGKVRCSTGGPDQALRRRHPARPDPRFRHPRRAARRQDHHRARMISPTGPAVDIPIENGFVGMVDREHFDEFLRNRAAEAGAERRTGTFPHRPRRGRHAMSIYRDKATGEPVGDHARRW
jgi:flavin-dependent dehydrogenase